jgi:chromosome segregation ATPase
MSQGEGAVTRQELKEALNNVVEQFAAMLQEAFTLQDKRIDTRFDALEERIERINTRLDDDGHRLMRLERTVFSNK